jgi:hypothetical protein
MYYKEREPRKFNYDDGPPGGIGKKAIHMIILLLFLIAVFLIFFPGPRGSNRQDGAEPDAENAAPSSSVNAAAFDF